VEWLAGTGLFWLDVAMMKKSIQMILLTAQLKGNNGHFPVSKGNFDLGGNDFGVLTYACIGTVSLTSTTK
jgi:hypothetical protein